MKNQERNIKDVLEKKVKISDEVEEGKGKVKEVGSETDLLGFCSDFALPLSRL